MSISPDQILEQVTGIVKNGQVGPTYTGKGMSVPTSKVAKIWRRRRKRRKSRRRRKIYRRRKRRRRRRRRRGARRSMMRKRRLN